MTSQVACEATTEPHERRRLDENSMQEEEVCDEVFPCLPAIAAVQRRKSSSCSTCKENDLFRVITAECRVQNMRVPYFECAVCESTVCIVCAIMRRHPPVPLTQPVPINTAPASPAQPTPANTLPRSRMDFVVEKKCEACNISMLVDSLRSHWRSARHRLTMASYTEATRFCSRYCSLLAAADRQWVSRLEVAPENITQKHLQSDGLCFSCGGFVLQ